MKASELVEKLNSIIAEHGDLPLVDDANSTINFVFEYDKEEDTEPEEAFVLTY